MSNESKTKSAFHALFLALESDKPNDRTKLDRAYAVTITELEKAFAYYLTFVFDPAPEG